MQVVTFLMLNYTENEVHIAMNWKFTVDIG